ncbi:GNAT family N-acetyltransferase [Chloroflexota bacterium]
MEREWSIRKYQEGDEKQLIELRKVIAGETRSERYWKWQFMDCPAGAAKLWLAMTNEKAVGQYVMIPIYMKIGDETVTGSMTLDLMTHPDYRRQGIFELLARKTYEEARRDEICITFGSPNELAYPGYIKKLDWFDICLLPRMTKILNLGSVLKRRTGNKMLSEIGSLWGNAVLATKYRALPSSYMPDVEIKRTSSFDDRIDEFWGKASANLKVAVVRDKKYLNWRYVDKPGHDYTIYLAERRGEVLGYVILKLVENGGRRGVIVDILALPDQEAIAHILIAKSVEHFKREDADAIDCWMLASSVYYGVLKKMGFMRRPDLRRLAWRFFTSKVSKEFLTDTNNLFFTRGDSDTI